MAAKKTLKVAFATYLCNGGDGSASVRFFPDVTLARKAADRDDERFAEDVSEHELEIDAATGEILSGVVVKVGETIDEDEEV